MILLLAWHVLHGCAVGFASGTKGGFVATVVGLGVCCPSRHWSKCIKVSQPKCLQQVAQPTDGPNAGTFCR